MEHKFDSQILFYTNQVEDLKVHNQEVTEEIAKLQVDCELRRTSYKSELEHLKIQYTKELKDLHEHEELYNSYNRQIESKRKHFDIHNIDKHGKAKIAFKTKENSQQMLSFSKAIEGLDPNAKVKTKKGEKTHKISKKKHKL